MLWTWEWLKEFGPYMRKFGGGWRWLLPIGSCSKGRSASIISCRSRKLRVLAVNESWSSGGN